MKQGVDLFVQLGLVATALRSEEQPQTVFAALERAFDATLGHKLFTILLQHRANGDSERVWTNNPVAYPLGGRKPYNPTRWGAQVLERAEAFLGRTPADIEAVFFDHALIASLGCGSVLNLPCVYRGRVIGTVNLLHEAGWYVRDDVQIGMPFASLIGPMLADTFRE